MERLPSACAWLGRDEGSVLLETALGVAIILAAALPFGALISYATQSARDLSIVQSAVRESARTGTTAGTEVMHFCGSSVDTTDRPCAGRLAHGSYIRVMKDTSVSLPFGLTVHTNATAVARVD